jgi:Conjugal transfer protein TraD
MPLFLSEYSENEGQAHSGQQLAGLTQTDPGTVRGLLLEGAQRLPQEQATRQRWQVVGEMLLATRTEERRVLQVRKRGVAHVV